jgi:four helix bundle protein
MAKQYDQLDAWRQLRESAASGPSNIAEGFGRYKPAQFRHFLDIAIASITETANHLRDGVDRKHFTVTDLAPLLTLAARARGAAIVETSNPEPRTLEPSNPRTLDLIELHNARTALPPLLRSPP